MRATLIMLSVALSACTPELGGCDEAAAVRVAHDTFEGMPAYYGQALMISSCGGDQFCHSANADALNRFGVPAGLELDVRIAGSDGTVNEAEVDRLRRGRFLTVQRGGDVLHTVGLGSMPPPGPAGEIVREASPVFTDQDGVALPPIDSPEAREILRNWLACGAPVVERPLPREDRVPSVVEAALYFPDLQPRWSSIYRDLLVARRCGNGSCHGAGGDERVGQFQITDCASTYEALFERAASGEACEGNDRVLVVPGAPDESVFLQKLTPDSRVCGNPMASLQEDDRAAIREWITSGAPGGCEADTDAGVPLDGGVSADAAP